MRKLILLLFLFALPAYPQNHARMLAGVNAQTGTTYTFVPGDTVYLVTFNNAAAVSVTLPAASTTGFGAGTIFSVKNIGLGNVTITVSSGTINGASSLLLVTNAGADIYSDGANFTSNGGSGGTGSGNAVSLNVLGKGTGPGLPLVDSQCSDDSVNPVRCQHGFNAATGGITYEVANDTSTGTTLNRVVCNNGSGKAVICTNNATSGILGVAQAQAGTTGNVLVCKLIACSVEFDNQSVINDYAIVASNGRLHDTGSTSPTANNTNFLVQSANAGANTAGMVVPPGDLTGATTAGMTNPMTTLGDIIYGGSAGTPTRLPGATTLNGVPQSFTSTASGGVATAPALAPGGIVPRIVSTTSDTILFTDRGKFIQYTNASPVAVTVPQAGTTGFANNFYFCAENRGAGAVTFTPTTSTVNGGATYTLATGSSGCFVSDNANYITKDGGTANAVVTNPSADQTITGAHALIMPDDGASFSVGTSQPVKITGNGNILMSGYTEEAGSGEIFGLFDVVTTDIGFFGPAGINIGWDLHIVNGDVPYARNRGSLDWTAGGFTSLIAVDPNGGVPQFIFGVEGGDDPTIPAVNGQLVAGSSALYGVYDPTNFERLVQQWSGNVAQIGTEAGGTGTLRKTQIIGAGFIVPDLEVKGSSSGTATIVAPAAAGTPTLTLPTSSGTFALVGGTAPTISSGFGTSPTVASNNGTATFRINVGTGGTATAGVIGLPSATTGWNCTAQNITAHAAHRADDTVFNSSTTSTATIENQTKSTGAAVAWTASDIVAVSCLAY